MSAGGPSGHRDPSGVATENRQLFRQKVESSINLSNDLIERRVRRERVADQRDIDAMRHGSCGKQREGLLGAHLPVTAMDEQKRRPAVGGFEEIDAVALARAVSEVEMIGVARPHFGGTPVPAGNHVGASSYGNAVVETAVAIFRGHGAPVGRIERRSHAQNSNCSALQRISTLPENVLQGYTIR